MSKLRNKLIEVHDSPPEIDLDGKDFYENFAKESKNVKN
jgi:hypothetical protein